MNHPDSHLTADSMAYVTSCAVCGAIGRAAERCRFDRACSCWRGIPCGRTPEWVRRAQSGTLPASDRTAGR